MNILDNMYVSTFYRLPLDVERASSSTHLRAIRNRIEVLLSIGDFMYLPELGPPIYTPNGIPINSGLLAFLEANPTVIKARGITLLESFEKSFTFSDLPKHAVDDRLIAEARRRVCKLITDDLRSLKRVDVCERGIPTSTEPFLEFRRRLDEFVSEQKFRRRFSGFGLPGKRLVDHAFDEMLQYEESLTKL